VMWGQGFPLLAFLLYRHSLLRLSDAAQSESSLTYIVASLTV
jgi:hypothetical protein